MRFKHKKIFKIIAIVIACCIGLCVAVAGAFILIISVNWSYLDRQHDRGEASVKEKAEFEKYYEDFKTLNDFVIKEYDQAKLDGSASDREHFFLDTKKGKIERYIPESNKDNWLSVDTKTKESIQKMSEYFTQYYDTIFVTENRVTFYCGEIMVIFMKDGTTPTYVTKPDEEEREYFFQKLKDNWYLMRLSYW